MGNAGTTYTYRITAEGVDAVKSAFDGLKDKLFEVAGVGGLGFMIENSLKTATNLEEMAQQAGMGTRQFQELSFALQQYGIDQQKASEELNRFNIGVSQFVTQNAGPAKKAFQALGFSQADVQQGAQNMDQFAQIVLGKIGKLDSEAQKLDLIKDFFGKGSSDLIGPADAGIAAMQAYAEEAERVGVVMSDDVITTAKDAETRLNTLYDILHMKVAIAIDENADKIAHLAQVATDNIPAVIKLMSGLASAAEGTENLGAAAYMQGYNDVQGFTALVNKLLPPGIKGFPVEPLVNPLSAFNSNDAGNDDGGIHVTVHRQPTSSANGGLTVGDPEADAMHARDAKLIADLQDEVDALGESQRQLAILEAQKRLSPIATDADKAAIGDAAGQLYDEKQAEQNQKVIDQLQKESDAATLDARSQFILSEQRKLNTDATEDQKDAVADLAGKYYDEQQAMSVLKKKQDELRESFKQVGDDVSQAFEDMSLNGGKFSAVLDTLLKQIEDIVYKDLVGNDLSSFISTGLNSIFGIPNTDTTHRAGGGPVDAGQLYQVNENNREYFRPNTGGQIIPLGGSTDSGVSVKIINNAPVQVTPQVSRGSGGTKDLVFVIDKLMAENASNPMSQFSIAQAKAGAAPTTMF